MVRRVGLGVVIAACTSVLAACSEHHGHHEDESAGAGAAAGSAAIEIGAMASARLTQLESPQRDPDHPFDGTAKFHATSSGVDLTIMIRGCMGRPALPVFIMEGTDCSPEVLAGPHWDGTRGEGLADIRCIGNSDSGRALTTRPHDAGDPWSIGGAAETDLIGHAVMVFDPVRQEPLACGVIARGESAEPVPMVDPGEGPPVEIRAQLAGLCLTSTFAPAANHDCPNPTELAACADEHCQLPACVAACAEYTACLEGLADPCEEQFSCPASDACTDCQLEVASCVLGFCVEEISCAPPPTPDGPCAQLEACCAMQGEDAPMCLELVRALEQLSGDVSCRGVMMDWDSNAHLAVPCNFE